MSLSTGQPQRPRIVIIDDEHELATMLSHALTDEGYEVVVCIEGRNALHCIKEHRPNAVILDVVMPDTDGFEVLRQLRNDPDGRRLPVILMSAAWRGHEKQRHIGATLDIAPTVVLPKPFELAELDRALLQLGITA
ncbi:response regulator [Kallotenue papyrolyticum]|uniref:response regulator n=1 Tax=Kallotenue papyrolyticum TaxID=1325125 RepID=UPI00047863F9|nr:response regulator [Kallotenue papyrolyticum]